MDKMLEDVFYLRAAIEYAEFHATDPSTQNGAVLVDGDGLIVAYGANHFADGVRETPERWERPAKYQWVEHAERNAIYAAARAGVRTEGLTMYCPWFACSDCARAIIQAGIKEVVGLRECNTTNERWNASIAVAMTMLEEAGVRCRWYEGKVDPENQLVVLRDGKPFYP